MNLLLVVSNANDVFIYNMAKWLKISMDVTINVFEFHHSHEQDCDYQYYDSVATAKPIPFPGKDFNPSFNQAYQLDKYLQEKHFDIIHCHLIVAADLLSRKLRSHCDRLFATFWGGEEYRKIIGSKKLYRNRLEKFLERIDCLMNSKHLLWLETFPFLREKFKEARLGSASLDIIYDLIKKYPRNEIKAELGFPNDKITVLIGYSGKSIHQHKEIIRNFSIRPQLRDKFHLLAIMTRGTVPEYAEEVECALTSSGYSYSMIKGHFLSDEQIARLRYGTDITLQLSTYDGFSRSIVECLCAGSIMIYGTWLNYDNRLKQEHFKAFPASSFGDAFFQIEKISKDPVYYQGIVKSNMDAGKMNTWEECIKDWVKAYTSD